MERLQSEARHLQELSARKALEEKMSKVKNSKPYYKSQCLSLVQELNSLSEQESLMMIEKLQKIEAKQKKQIER